jgi:hypothetical protein
MRLVRLQGMPLIEYFFNKIKHYRRAFPKRCGRDKDPVQLGAESDKLPH